MELKKCKRCGAFFASNSFVCPKCEEKDKVEPSLNTPVEKNMRITVIRAFKVKIVADGCSREILSTPISVKEAIKLAGVQVGEQDIIKTTARALTAPEQEIEVIRVTQEEIEIKEPIAFQVERTSDDTLERGLSRTVKPGIEGVALNKIKITYHNGNEVNREVTSCQRLLEPVNRLVALGTITSVSRAGQRLDFREAKYMNASAYTYTGRNTATGRQPAVGLVAVDPTVVPMGSKLYIEGYGYAEAADTGGAIKGNRLDLFMEEKTQCINWGNRTVKMYILD